MSDLNSSAASSRQQEIFDAFMDPKISQHDFLEILEAAVKADVHSAFLRCRVSHRIAQSTGQALAVCLDSSQAAEALDANLEHWIQENDNAQARCHELEIAFEKQEMELRQQIASLTEQLEQSQAQMSNFQMQYTELQQRVDSSHSLTLHDDTAGGGGGGARYLIRSQGIALHPSTRVSKPSLCSSSVRSKV